MQNNFGCGGYVYVYLCWVLKLLIDLWLSGVILKFREFCTLARNFNYEPRLVGGGP